MAYPTYPRHVTHTHRKKMIDLVGEDSIIHGRKVSLFELITALETPDIQKEIVRGHANEKTIKQVMPELIPSGTLGDKWTSCGGNRRRGIRMDKVERVKERAEGRTGKVGAPWLRSYPWWHIWADKNGANWGLADPWDATASDSTTPIYVGWCSTYTM